MKSFKNTKKWARVYAGHDSAHHNPTFYMPNISSPLPQKNPISVVAKIKMYIFYIPTFYVEFDSFYHIICTHKLYINKTLISEYMDTKKITTKSF